jgi:hypothetical protein
MSSEWLFPSMLVLFALGLAFKGPLADWWAKKRAERRQIIRHRVLARLYAQGGYTWNPDGSLHIVAQASRKVTLPPPITVKEVIDAELARSGTTATFPDDDCAVGL